MAESTVREQKQAERRGRVIEAAMLLAAEGGYDAVHMRDVSARADVAMGTIYRYFSSKDELLVAGLVGWIDIVQARRAAPVKGETALERVLTVLDASARRSDRNPMLMRALITAMASTDPAVAVYKRKVEERVGGLIVDALRDEPGIDVDGVQRVIRHVWFSAIVRWVGGMAPDGSVRTELHNAARLLLGPR